MLIVENDNLLSQIGIYQSTINDRDVIIKQQKKTIKGYTQIVKNQQVDLDMQVKKNNELIDQCKKQQIRTRRLVMSSAFIALVVGVLIN